MRTPAGQEHMTFPPPITVKETVTKQEAWLLAISGVYGVGRLWSPQQRAEPQASAVYPEHGTMRPSQAWVLDRAVGNSGFSLGPWD